MECKQCDLHSCQNPLICWVACDKKCASKKDVVQVKNSENPTRRHLGYTKTFLEVPEYWKIEDNGLHLLPCINDYSVVRIYDTLSKILSALYDKNKLHNKVLLHIKSYRRYTEKGAGPYLKF